MRDPSVLICLGAVRSCLDEADPLSFVLPSTHPRVRQRSLHIHSMISPKRPARLRCAVASLITLIVGFAGEASAQNTTLRFAAEINGNAFTCGGSYALGSASEKVIPTDLRVFVSEIQAIRSDGQQVALRLVQDQTWQVEQVALLDFENGQGPCSNGTSAVNTTVRGDLPAGEYRGLRFTIGIPFGLNHADPTIAPAPLNTTAMFWNWQGGYKFIRFDTPGFPLHLGSTQCAAESRTSKPSGPCAQPNRIEVSLDAFDLKNDILVLDFGTILRGTDVRHNTPKTQPGCMSFPGDADCIAVMRALGLPYDGQPAPGSQQLVHRRTASSAR